MAGSNRRRRGLSWDEWYRLAAGYRQEHGDLLIPKDYVCPGGEKLGRWIERQRGKYNGVASVPGHLDRTQILLLDQLDMVWKLEYRHDWSDWLKQLDWYRQTFGNLDIPHNFERGEYHLGNWIVKQRVNCADGLLGEREIADLDARGMIWNARTRPRPWEAWYADAAAYYRAHGDLRVTLDYQTPEGNKLGFWIYRQRDIYMGRKPGLCLTAEQIEQLEAVGMVWNPPQARLEAWDQMYLWVSEYLERNGKLPLWPRDLKSPDGRSMWDWIRAQRQLLADGRVQPSRREKLAALGILPPARTMAAGGTDTKAVSTAVSRQP